MSTSDPDRKRLWGRSGNRCAICHQELVRDDTDLAQGALVGQEAHIVARSPGGPRYQPLEPAVRDGYANLILLCANDHIEIDSQPDRYPVDVLHNIKRGHETWVSTQLDDQPTDRTSEHIVAVAATTGTQLWNLLQGAFGYQTSSPDDLTDDEADLVDGALQTLVDWGDISEDVTAQGQRAIRDAKRSLQSELEALDAAGFVVLTARYDGPLAGGAITGPITVLHVVHTSELHQYARPSPDNKAPNP